MILEREHLDNLLPLFEKVGVTDGIIDTISEEDLKASGSRNSANGVDCFWHLRMVPAGRLISRRWPRSAEECCPTTRNLRVMKSIDFRIGKYPVTQLEWERVRLWATAHGFKLQSGEGNGSRYPITQVKSV
jgi:hypothetical protein